MSRKQRSHAASEPTANLGGAERLQKVLAAAGVGSRRDCEELIEQGRVAVDREVVTELGTKVDPLRQEIRVDGTILRQPKRVYYVLNKPIGVVSTNFDPSGRTRIIDLLPTDERLFPVGRLDRSSEGLIVVTNDGAFANRLTHPRYGVEKTYHVRIAGSPSEKELLRLRKGVHLSDGLAKLVSLRVKGRHKQSTDLEIVLNEGKNREIRRILARVGHKVVGLKRTAVGTLKLGELPVGGYRKLTPQEVTELMSLTKRKRKDAKGKQSDAAPTRAPSAPASATGGPRERQTPRRTLEGGMKPPQGKRRPSPYPVERAAPPPADDLLRLEDFLPPLQDEEGDEVEQATPITSAARLGRVLGYEGEETLASREAPDVRPSHKPHRAERSAPGKRPGRQGYQEQRGGSEQRGQRPRKPQQKTDVRTGRQDENRRSVSKRAGKPGGKFAGKPAGKLGGQASGKFAGKPGRRKRGKG